MSESEALREKLRSIPSVDALLGALSGLESRFPRSLIVDETRRVLAAARRRMIGGGSPDTASLAAAVVASLESLQQPSLRRLINATGVVLHTNLGRAPLGPLDSIPGYSNLEYDLAEGGRGKRDAHLSPLLDRLLGVPGIAVNNNAAAVFLVLNELAAGFEVIVSRGELIEIGDGFRIPDIMRRSGAVLREVGTTNRTRIEDYAEAITDRTRLLMRVHASNFRLTGFTGRPQLSELASLGRERGIPVYEDLGSGCLVDLSPFGIDEPTVQASLKQGAGLISFSGDKLLGGPQAGLIAGDPALVTRLRRNPMFRALRLDKLILQSLEHTLRLVVLGRWREIPALAMIAEPAESVRRRAEAFAARLHGLDVETAPGESLAGGGSTPEQTLPTWLVLVGGIDAAKLERRCREGDPAVVARIEDGRLALDLRTVFPAEEAALAEAVRRAATIEA